MRSFVKRRLPKNDKSASLCYKREQAAGLGGIRGQSWTLWNTMSGRGKGSAGLGLGGAKRHIRVYRDNVQGISKPSIRRLARRGGVKRILSSIYIETRNVLKEYLETVIHDAVVDTLHAQRETVTALDVAYALKRQGRQCLY